MAEVLATQRGSDDDLIRIAAVHALINVDFVMRLQNGFATFLGTSKSISSWATCDTKPHVDTGLAYERNIRMFLARWPIKVVKPRGAIGDLKELHQSRHKSCRWG